MRRLGLLVRVVLPLLAAGALHAAPPVQLSALNRGLNEEVVRIRLNGTMFELETTIFKPDGPGPFPLLVFNHGKPGDNLAIALDRGRIRYPLFAHEFVKRGWMVALPMRRGFGNSDGMLPSVALCDVAAYAQRDAEDIAGAVDALAARRDVDPTRIAVMGGSAGGIATVAYAPSARGGVKAVVSFAGGLRIQGEGARGCWPAAMVDGYARLARQSGPPQLWVYADNDRTFPPAVVRDSLQAFEGAGGHAEFLMLPPIGADGHNGMLTPEGMAQWLPEVLAFLGAQGLPVSTFPGSGFAKVDDVDALPAPPQCRRQYERYLTERPPKAYALSRSNRACTWAARGERAAEQALDACRKNAPDCALYAFDDIVVWKPQ